MDQLNRLKILSDSDDIQHYFTFDDTLETLFPPLHRRHISYEENDALLLMFKTFYKNYCTQCLSTSLGSADPPLEWNYQQETTEQKSCICKVA